jgi:hypothetical protein
LHRRSSAAIPNRIQPIRAAKQLRKLSLSHSTLWKTPTKSLKESEEKTKAALEQVEKESN